MKNVLRWRRVLVTMLLAGVVGTTLAGCVLVPVPVGGGGYHRHHDRW